MIEIRSANQYPQIRIVLGAGLDDQAVATARRERENLKRRLRRRRPDVKAKRVVYDRARRDRPGELERRRAQKRAWREENREAYNAYFRRYDALTPGRREYKAMKARDYRARDRAARAQ